MRWARPGNERSPLHRSPAQAERQRGRGGAGGVLGVVQPAQRADAADLGDRRGLPAARAQDRARAQHKPRRPAAAAPKPARPACRPARVRSAIAAAPFVIDADDRDAVLRHAGDQALLHRGVVLHRAVTVEMILADVDQDADARDRARARDRSDTTSTRRHGRGPAAAAPATGSRCRYCRQSARRGRPTRARCAISAVVVDLPLVPVMATNGASGAWRRRSRQNSSMSPITSTPALRASSTLQCGADGSAERPAPAPAPRCSHQSSVAQIGGRNAGRARLAPRSRHCRRRRPRRRRRPAARWQLARPEPPRPNTATVLPAKVVTGITRVGSPQLQVDRPASASTTATIQKRMTICGSVQPSCSK